MKCTRRLKGYIIFNEIEKHNWILVIYMSPCKHRSTEIKENKNFKSAGLLVLILFQEAVSSTQII